ncbi:MAG: arylsulfatase [Pseudomonadota bacterium]
MKKSLFLSVCVFSSLLYSATSRAADDERPNILLVLFDDVGFSGFGVYGSDARTPRIDALAQKGVILSRYYTAPFCGPTRAMLMTGMDSHQVGMGTLVETVTKEMRSSPGYSMRWDADQETIGTLLSGAGYQTYVTGKWGIGEIGANLPSKFGFDRSYVMDATGGGNYDAKPYLPGSHAVKWFEDGEPTTLVDDYYSSRTLVDKMIDYVDASDPEQPFFAYLSLQAAHMPIQAPLDYVDRYNGAFDDGWDVKRQERLQRTIDRGLVPPTTTLAPAPAVHRAWDDLSAEEKAVAAREMQVNAGMMEAADFHIGRLLDHLEATGQLENTIVMVLSDNGAESGKTSFDGLANLGLDAIKLIEGFDTSFENLGQRRSLTAVGPEWASVLSAPFDLYKFYGSEGGLRVPMVIAGPGIAASGVEHAPVHVADLVPTMLDAAGVPYDPAQFYGHSALPMLSGRTDTTYNDNESFAFEVSGNAALYRGQWKITRNTPPRGDAEWRLYDLSVDPGETTDLSAANPALFEDMLAEYRAYTENVGVFEVGPDDYAITALNKNLMTKVIHKYWPHMLVFLLAVGGALFFAFKMGRTALRRRAS